MSALTTCKILPAITRMVKHFLEKNPISEQVPLKPLAPMRDDGFE